MPLVEHELPILPEHLSFSGVHGESSRRSYYKMFTKNGK